MLNGKKKRNKVDDLQQTKSNIEDLKLQADRSEREAIMVWSQKLDTKTLR